MGIDRRTEHIIHPRPWRFHPALVDGGTTYIIFDANGAIVLAHRAVSEYLLAEDEADILRRVVDAVNDVSIPSLFNRPAPNARYDVRPDTDTAGVTRDDA